VRPRATVFSWRRLFEIELFYRECFIPFQVFVQRCPRVIALPLKLNELSASAALQADSLAD